MNLRAIYHPTGKFSTDCTGILFDQAARDLFIDAGYGPRKTYHFPSYLMHQVNPYTGDAPRISLSWNFQQERWLAARCQSSKRSAKSWRQKCK